MHAAEQPIEPMPCHQNLGLLQLKWALITFGDCQNNSFCKYLNTDRCQLRYIAPSLLNYHLISKLQMVQTLTMKPRVALARTAPQLVHFSKSLRKGECYFRFLCFDFHFILPMSRWSCKPSSCLQASNCAGQSWLPLRMELIHFLAQDGTMFSLLLSIPILH